jgi:hypothetical protein
MQEMSSIPIDRDPLYSPDITMEYTENTRQNESGAVAKSLYPLETWIEVSERVCLARSRRPWSKSQTQILEKELTQARVLAALGSEVYLLPERGGDGKSILMPL